MWCWQSMPGRQESELRDAAEQQNWAGAHLHGMRWGDGRLAGPAGGIVVEHQRPVLEVIRVLACEAAMPNCQSSVYQWWRLHTVFTCHLRE